MDTVEAVTACIQIGAAPVRGLGRGEVVVEIMTTLHPTDDRLSSGGCVAGCSLTAL